MGEYHLYEDIAQRTNGEIYLGVVGPVRTGKSTFIKRFMELMVLPRMEEGYGKERTRDELPQSAGGKNIMTTEPKFVPNEAVEIQVGDSKMKVRLIDCVGYVVPGAEGHMEEDSPRMVHTPWSEETVPFAEAAEIGTRKVITDHSTIGIVVTTDGTVTDLPQEAYHEAEGRVIRELREMGKPFVVLLNTSKPYSPQTAEKKAKMEEEYAVPVLPVNAAQLKEDDMEKILSSVLYQFPLQEVWFSMPLWVETLSVEHPLRKEMMASFKELLPQMEKLADLPVAVEKLSSIAFLDKVRTEEVAAGEGVGKISLTPREGLFYEILSETVELPIRDDSELIETIRMLSQTKKEYDRISSALADAKMKGYGVVAPAFEEIRLEKPEVFKQGSRYGIRLRAKGESYHFLKADIETEVSPIIGNEAQSSEFIEKLIADYETEPEKIWDLNIFGHTLSSMVSDGMQNKLYRMPEDAREKMQETLQRIVNEGSGGLICIIL